MRCEVERAQVLKPALCVGYALASRTERAPSQSQRLADELVCLRLLAALRERGLSVAVVNVSSCSAPSRRVIWTSILRCISTASACLPCRESEDAKLAAVVSVSRWSRPRTHRFFSSVPRPSDYTSEYSSRRTSVLTSIPSVASVLTSPGPAVWVSVASVVRRSAAASACSPSWESERTRFRGGAQSRGVLLPQRPCLKFKFKLARPDAILREQYLYEFWGAIYSQYL